MCKSMIKIAIQKKGRLHDESLQLLKDVGINISNGKDQLKVKADNFPLEILYLRNSDIPKYLADGVVDIAIIGKNLVVEQGSENLKIIENLGFSKCHLSLAVPKKYGQVDLNFFAGKKIATSYPNTLKSFLKQHQIKAGVHLISGSVEIAPNIGLADAICDIVSTGSTLFKNGLIETIKILDSEAVLVQTPFLNTEKKQILNQLLFRIRAVLKAKKYKYIMLNTPNSQIDAIVDILPVLESPTIIPLKKPNWSSIHSVIKKDQFWEVLERLKQAGAQDIIITPIEKMLI